MFNAIIKGENCMRRWFGTVAFALVFAVSPVLAQLDDHPEPVPPKRTSQVKIGGGIGITSSWLSLDFAPINSVLASSNAATFSNGSLYLSGVHGYAYLLFVPNLRTGALGLGGSVESSALEAGTNTRRDVKLSVGMLGAMIEYVIPVVPRVDVAVGTMIGGGNMKLIMTRDDGGGKVWGDLWSEYGSSQPSADYSRTFEGSFFMVQPSLAVEVAVMRWLGLRVGASYLASAGNSWTLDDTYDVAGVPSDIKPQGVNFVAGIYLGTFIF